MHELSLCHQMARIVSRAAAGRAVAVVHVEAGQLRQVVPESLVNAWGFVVAGTELEGSELRVTPVPARLHCDLCGGERFMDGELGFDCRECGGPRSRVISGEEFRVTAIDLD